MHRLCMRVYMYTPIYACMRRCTWVSVYEVGSSHVARGAPRHACLFIYVCIYVAWGPPRNMYIMWPEAHHGICILGGRGPTLACMCEYTYDSTCACMPVVLTRSSVAHAYVHMYINSGINGVFTFCMGACLHLSARFQYTTLTLTLR